MKKLWSIALILAVICGSTFANTELFSLGGDVKYHFKQEDVTAFDIFTGVHILFISV